MAKQGVFEPCRVLSMHVQVSILFSDADSPQVQKLILDGAVEVFLCKQGFWGRV